MQVYVMRRGAQVVDYDFDRGGVFRDVDNGRVVQACKDSIINGTRVKLLYPGLETSRDS